MWRDFFRPASASQDADLVKNNLSTYPGSDNPTSTTMAARLTAEVPAAIATLAIRGPRACELIRARVRLSGQRLEAGIVYYGTWQLPLDSAEISNPTALPPAEQVVVCRTGSDMVEVHCHGGAAVCQAILQDLAQAGCAIVAQGAWPTELTCPLARAAQQDLLLATTDRAAAMLLDQMHGALRTALTGLLESLSRDDSADAGRRLQDLLLWSELGQHLAQPWKIVLAGPPNVGKSSLMNALVGTHQAIVHHEPGTTRDWIEAAGAIDGLPVLFTDTAGIRSGDDAIEQAGVERSRQRLQSCDLAIFVVDALWGWTDVHEQLLEIAPRRRLVAWNKMDLFKRDSASGMTAAEGLPTMLPCIATSAVDKLGISELLTAISQQLFPCAPAEGTAVPFRFQHLERLQACEQWLQAGEISRARDSIAEWLSEVE